MRHQLLVQSRWIHLSITNAVAQLTPFLVLLCAMQGLDSTPNPVTRVELFAAYAIALLLTAFPITPGGLGTVDAALVGLLVAFGADSAVAVAADLIWRLVWFLPQLLVGMVTMCIYLLGRRRAFTTGVLVFTLASVVCALAPSVGFLVGAAVAGALFASGTLASDEKAA